MIINKIESRSKLVCDQLLGMQLVCYFLICLLFELSANAFNHHNKRIRRPNVIFAIFDDLRPAISSGYNDPFAKTPNIDRLMRKSFYFTRAYCQQALCAPSRNSMMTSRRPDTLHLYDFDSYWRDTVGSYTTLPQYFKQNGYYTYSIGKVFHHGISSNYTDDYPYSWSDPAYHPSTEQYMNSPVCPTSDENGELKANLICPVKIKSQPEETLPDIQSATEAREFLRNYEDGYSVKPFFLAIGFHKPHVPFRVPHRWYNKIPKEKFNTTKPECKPFEMPNVAWNPYNDIRKRDDVKNQSIKFPFGPIPQEFQISIKQAYYSAVSYVDHLFGKILKMVDRDNTIVIMTSDHGWSLGEHGEWAKFSNFEVALRVPLIIYSPEFKLQEPVKIESIVELVDIFPSLVDLAKLPKIPRCGRNQEELCTQGKSFYDLMKHYKREKLDFSRFALSQYPRPGDFPTKRPNSDEPKLNQTRIMGYSIRTNEFRYTLWVKFYWRKFSKDWNRVYGEELYDHRFDDKENKNLAKQPGCREIRNRLKYLLIKNFSS